MSNPKPLPCTQADLHQRFIYDDARGVLIWRVRPGPKSFVHPGDVVGTTDSRGRVYTKMCGRRCMVHRLIWLYVTGEDALEDIDHRDGNNSNNRFSNLRLGGGGINQQNLHGATSRNKSGVLGVHLRHGAGGKPKYYADIGRDGKVVHLGWYKTPEEAYTAYVTAKRELHPGGML